MRSRNIKPGFFTNEMLGTMDPLLSLLFAGLWCIADRDGKLEDRPLRIKAEVFPYREGLDINGYLTVLSRLGFIQRYEVAGKGYIYITEFHKHQSPHKTEKKSTIPNAPEKSNSCLQTVDPPLNNGESRPDSLIPDSLIPDSLIPDSKTKTLSDKSDDVLFEIILASGTIHNLTRPFFLSLQKAFPSVDVMKALAEMAAYALRHPSKRVNGDQIENHIVGCLQMLSRKAEEFERLWNRYPAKDGRKAAERHFRATVQTEDDLRDIHKALDNYLAVLSENPKRPPKNGSTWFNNWRDWTDYTAAVRNDITEAELFERLEAISRGEKRSLKDSVGF